jgi:hypothetical protein
MSYNFALPNHFGGIHKEKVLTVTGINKLNAN